MPRLTRLSKRLLPRRSQIRNPRPLSKLLLLQLKVDKRMAPVAAHSTRAEKAWSRTGGRRGRCCFVHSAVGCRSLSLPPPSQVESVVPGTAASRRSGAWSTGEVAWPLPVARPLRGLHSRPPPSRPPSSRASGLWRDGIPWWFYHTLNPHTFHSSRSQQLSIGSWERPGNKGGGAESMQLKARRM